MRNRIVTLSWTAGLAVAVAVTSFMVSAPAEAVRTCRSEKQVTYRWVCRFGRHISSQSFSLIGDPPRESRCWKLPVTRTVLVCHQSPAVPRAPKPGRPPIKLN